MGRDLVFEVCVMLPQGLLTPSIGLDFAGTPPTTYVLLLGTCLEMFVIRCDNNNSHRPKIIFHLRIVGYKNKCHFEL